MKSQRSVLTTIFKFSTIIGAILGLLIAALFMILFGINPGKFIIELIKGGIGSWKAIGNTLNRAAPYMIVGASTVIGFESGSMNMGQEGQVFMGGLGAALVALAFPNLPGPIAIPLAILGGMVVAGIYVLIPTIMKLIKGINEVLTTLIMNYVATLIVSALVIGPLACSAGSSYPRTDDFGAGYSLPMWKNIGRMHAGVFIAIGVSIFFIYLFWVSPIGLKMRAAGMSPTAARTAGINPTRYFVIGMLINGSFCGMAGAVELMGRYTNLRGGYADGIGWDSLIVALISGLNPKGIIPAAVFFGALYTGMSSLQRSMGVPSALLNLIKGIIVIFCMAGTAFNKYHAKKFTKARVKAA